MTIKIRFNQEPKTRLTIEMIPETSYGRNLRSMIPEERWNEIRREVYRRSNYACEICGGRGEHHPVECHEIWEFDDANQVQKLVGYLALCPSCHAVKHIGRTMHSGGPLETIRALRHLSKVNGWNILRAVSHLREALKVHSERSLLQWKIDIGYAKEAPSDPN